jgi:hypothetical protein
MEHPQGVPFEPFLGLQVFDLVDKSLTVNDIVVAGEVDIVIPGDYHLVYTLTDRQGNVFEKEVTVTVYESEGYVLPTNFVIFNSDFEEDQTASAAAGTGWGWHGSGQWNIEIVDGVAVIDVFETWTRFFGVQFYHLNREVTGGHTYRITFRAKADIARPIQLNLEPTGSGFVSYFQVTTEWQEFVYEYKNEGNTFTNGKFSFFFGNLPGLSGPTTFYLDDVKVERILEKSDDTTAPLLLGVDDMYYQQGMPFDPLAGIIVYDHYDKALTIDDVMIEGLVDTDVLGDHDLVYTVTDSAGNVATYTRVITVVNQEDLIAPRFEFLDTNFANDPVITNQDGNLGWTLKTSGTGAFTSEIVDDVLGITVTNNGTVPHGIQFFQRNGFRSEAGSTYLITFRVRADETRDIHVIMEETTLWRNLTRHVVEITNEWVTYQVVLKNTLKSHADVKIGFFLGLSDALAPERSALTTIYFDFVTVELIGYVKDDQAPRIFAPDATITVGAVFNPLSGIKYGDFAKTPSITVTSVTEGLVTYNSVTNAYTVDTSVVGVYELTYTLVDPYGNETVHIRTLTIEAEVE